MTHKINPILKNRWSGGGSNLANNVALARELYPEVFSEEGVPIIFRNIVPLSFLISGNYIYIPQNAWAWHGPAKSLKEKCRRFLIRCGSIVAHRRAQQIIRIGPLIPDGENCAKEFLPNVLDLSFEAENTAFTDQQVRPPWLPQGDFFLAPGSLISYRNIELLIMAYKKYTTETDNINNLIIIGPSLSSSYLKKLENLCSDLPRVKIISKFVKRTEILIAIKQAELCIFPSMVEASPVTLLEASAIGRSCAAWDQPGHTYLINQSNLRNAHLFTSAKTLTQLMLKTPRAEISPVSTRKHRDSERERWVKTFLQLTTSSNVD